MGGFDFILPIALIQATVVGITGPCSTVVAETPFWLGMPIKGLVALTWHWDMAQNLNDHWVTWWEAIDNGVNTLLDTLNLHPG